MKGVSLIIFPRIQDPRGNLTFIENGTEMPFQIARSYWIYDVPGGEQRGGHAFRNSQEVIIVLSGSFDVVVHDGKQECRHPVSRSYYGLYIPEMMWRYLDNFSTNSVALVLSSTIYDPNDYICDFSQFEKVAADAS